MIAAGLAVAAVSFAQAQSEVYVVGNISDWTAPAEANFDFYQQFRMKEAGRIHDKTVWQADFDISSLDQKPMFRFYEGLNGWEIGSFGSQQADSPIDFTIASAEEGLTVVEGKGAFNFPDWEGDHIYIALCGNVMTASPDHYVEIPRFPEVYSTSYGYFSDMAQCPDNPGVYVLKTFSGVFNIDGYIAVPGKIAGDEAKEFLYINPTEEFKIDEFGIASAEYTYSDSPQGFLLTAHSNMITSDAALFLDTNSQKIILNTGVTRWITGSFNENKQITFDNYKDFGPHYTSGEENEPIYIDVPEGKLNVAIVAPTLENKNLFDIMWNGTSAYLNPNQYNLVWDSCPGGKLVWINGSSLTYINGDEQIYLSYPDTNGNLIAQKLNPGSDELVLETTIDIPENPSNFFFYLSYGEITSGLSIYPESGGSWIFNGQSPVTKKYQLQAWTNEQNICQFPYGGKIIVRVNTADREITISPVDCTPTILPLASYIVGENDEVELTPAILNTELYSYGFWVYDEIYNNECRDICFRFQDGNYLIPDLSSAIYDKNCVFSYSYTLSKEKKDAIIPFPQAIGNNLGAKFFNIDATNKTISIYDSNSNLSEFSFEDGIRVPREITMDVWEIDEKDHSISHLYKKDDQAFGLETYSVIPRMTLTQADLDTHTFVYEGNFSLLNDEATYFILSLGTVPNYFNTYYPFYGVDAGYFNYGEYFSPALNPVLERPASLSYNPNPICIYPTDAPLNYAVKVTMESPTKITVWIGNGEAGVENTILSEEVFNVVGLNGAIRIDTNADQNLAIYNLSGMMVRNLEIQSGITFIQGIDPGIYIIKGKKVIVK